MTTEPIPADTLETTPAKDRLADVLDQAPARLRDFLVHGLAQVRVLRKAYPGLMHSLIFWGMTIQVVGTIISLMQIPLFIPFVELPFPRNLGYLGFELVMDLGGLAIILGALMALFRRVVLKPQTLETRWDDYYALGMLLLIPLAGFFVESLRLVATSPGWAGWSPIGLVMADSMRALGMSATTAANLHYTMYWVHIIFALALVGSIPFTKLRHLVSAPLNIMVRPLRSPAALETIEDIEEVEILGVGQVSEFQPHQLLSFDACLRCGRCDEVCPALTSGMPLSPRNFIQELRTSMVDNLVQANGKAGNEIPLDETISSEVYWSCTTCGACLMACPVFINPVTELVDLRRYSVLTTGDIPKSVADVLRNIERQGNPWGMPPQDRTAWTEGLNVRTVGSGDKTDVLLFMGCAAAFDSRNRKVSRSFVRLLQTAGVDFAILGMDECCCGETARRLGHEYIFQVMAEQNVEILSEVKFNRIVTQCPHCFNTIKNEYPQFGGDFEILHYTEYLAELIRQPGLGERILADNLEIESLTLHDSCYLGRYNDIYQAPREILDSTGLLRVEMENKEANGFCCGGGGGQMWMETDPNTRINQRRLEEVIATNTGVVATACPYCMIMFDDAIRSKGLGESVQVLDIAEILCPEETIEP